MDKRNLIICDREDSFGRRLGELLVSRRELSLQVRYCRSMEKMICFSKRDSIHILILGEAEEKEWRDQVPVGKLFRLTTEQKKGREYIYKYQSGTDMIRQVVEVCMDEGMELQNTRGGRKQIIGIYSPIHRIGKTSFALTLGQALSRKDSTLYLNMEDYAGLGGHFPESTSQNLSDFFYYVRQEEQSLGVRLRMLVHQREGLDYLSPIPIHQDLRELPGKDWILLLDQILAKSIYTYLVLDLGDSIQGLTDILGKCDTVYMPILEEPVAQAKIRQFERNLTVMGREDLKNKLQKMVLSASPWEDVQQVVEKMEQRETGDE